MIVIGIGSTSAATVADVLVAIGAMEKQAGVVAQLVATLLRGGLERPILLAAMTHGVDCRLLTATKLAARNAECVTQSNYSFDAHGVWSVSEAAALAGAGPQSRLLLPRQTFTNVTAALAIRQENS